MTSSPFLRVYGVPSVLCVLTIGGLVLALVYEGGVDAFALLLVALPIVVIVRYLLKLRASARETRCHS